MSSKTGRKCPQMMAAAASALGVFALGAAMGWTQPVAQKAAQGEYKFTMSREEFAWTASFVALGPACSCIPAGYISDAIGLRATMLAMTLPFLGGFIMQAFAINIVMLYIARFILGFVGGTFCILMPIYAVEISQNNIRGILGSFYQQFLMTGMTFSYIVGPFLPLFWFNILLCGLPMLFFVIFVFMPESPKHYVRKNQIDRAIETLRRLRGERHDCTLEALAVAAAYAKSSPMAYLTAIRRQVVLKGLGISITLMFVQQFSGINILIYYWTGLMQQVGSPVEPYISTIVLGILSTIATLITLFTVDKYGRRIILLISSCLQALTTLILGTHFFYEKSSKNFQRILKWLSLPTACVFIVAFSIGFGPIPWVIMAEIFTATARRLAVPIVGMSSWLFAFLSTVVFNYTDELIGEGPTFWLCSLCSAFGFIFVLFFVPETKGIKAEKIHTLLETKKQLEDIEQPLDAPS